MVYPETFGAIPWWAHTWLSNLEVAHELGRRLGLQVDPLAYIDYPLGSMFWARTEALRPLFDLNLTRDDFPPEQGQSDGTTQHAMERLLGQVVRQYGGVLGILSADGTSRLLGEGERNWTAYFNATLASRIEFAAVDARCVSFDLFDTLVTRPFLRPSGLRDFVAHQVARIFGLMDFAELREQAELSARANSGHDVDSTAIYAAMARLPELRGFDTAAIRDLELSTEARLLKPRIAVLDAALAQARSGKRVIAVSDMYLNASELRHVLPESVSRVLQAIHVSCDTGWRKDSGDTWRQLPRREGIAPTHWLHVGDNEHADIQLPLAQGLIAPVHTMRPGALLDVVPALRPLRPPPVLLDRWQDQLWLGLLAIHFGAMADRRPEMFGRQLIIETPETFGYAVLGPLLLDYSTWLTRVAREVGARRILFLSREGYLLLRAFRRLQQADGSLEAIHASYLLVSRRAVNTPSLRAIEDLSPILAAPYTGPLGKLLRARLGDRVAEAVGQQLGPTAIASEVYLPEMSASLIELLRPAAESILDIARDERTAYLAYWSEQTDGGNAIVADIGYAGTIQSRLTAITGASLHGAYFAVKKETAPLDKGNVAARFHDGRRDHGEVSPVMLHHLLLEAAITSPDGQFSHFSPVPEGVTPRHFPNAMDPVAWAIVERMQSGAMQFIDDVCAVTGTDSGELAFDSKHVQKPLHCVGTGLWRLGDWAGTLSVEDQYSGRGDVTVAEQHDAL
jgi:FMN phosphatase YigB (HAD superfamily)